MRLSAGVVPLFIVCAAVNVLAVVKRSNHVGEPVPPLLRNSPLLPAALKTIAEAPE